MHYYQFNIGDYQSHTAHLDPLEDLAYRRMLDWCYLHEKPLPFEANEIARIIRMRDDAAIVRDVLNEFFSRYGEGWVCDRVLKEIEHYKQKVEQASRAGKASAERRSIGRSTDVQLTNNQEPITNNHKPIKERATSVACPPDVSEQVWQDWLLLRKSKKASVTETVVKGARSEAEKLGWALERFLVEWCTRGSQGLKAEWVEKPNGLTKTGQMNRTVMSGLTRGLMGGNSNVKFLEK